VILNPVVDGLLYYSVKHEGRTWPHYGRFVQIDRPRRVEYTWMSEGTKGAESIVTVTMESRGNETEVTLHHTGVPDDEMGRKHKEGWTWVLSALAEVFVSRKSSFHGSLRFTEVGFVIRLGQRETRLLWAPCRAFRFSHFGIVVLWRA